MKLLITVLLSILAMTSIALAETSLEYTGRLIDTTSGSPVTTGIVDIVVQVKDPNAGTCYLYQNFYRPAPDVDGNFKINITGVPVVGGGSFGTSLQNVLDSKNSAGVTCFSSTGVPGAVFAPSGDQALRNLHVLIYNTTTAAWEEIDQQGLRPAYEATNASMLSGATVGLATGDIVAVGAGGRIPLALIPNLDATRVPSLDAGIITTGSIDISRGGTGATTAIGARNNLLPTQGGFSNAFLMTNGANVSWGTIPGMAAVTSILTGTGLSGGPIISQGTISLADTSVTPGSYGGIRNVATFTVDQQGRLTAAGSIAIAIDGSQVGSGTISAARLEILSGLPVAVNSNTYVPTLSVDMYGRVISLGSTAISFPASGSANSPSTIVARDAFGNFAAGTISASRFIGALGANLLDGTLSVAKGGTGTGGLPTCGANAFLRFDGTNWFCAAPAASGLQSLNNLTDLAQFFSLSSTGSLSVFTSVGSIHNLNIPMAATAASPGGLISNAQYLALTNGTIPNSRTTARSTNIADSIVSRDGFGNFAAGTISASRFLGALSANFVDGTLSVANGGTGTGVLPTCGASQALKYDGTNWSCVTYAAVGGNLDSINGLTDAGQFLQLATTGTLLAWTSSGSIHTLNVPFVSTPGANSGILTRNEFNQFNSGTIGINRGGTGLGTSAVAAGQLLIGNGSGFALGTLTSGTNIQILNQNGTITISSSAGGGSVVSVQAGAGLTGGTITSSGTIGLDITGITAGTYGGASWIPNFVVDGFGRLMSAGSVDIVLPANRITSGTLNTAVVGDLPFTSLNGTISTLQLGTVDGSTITNINGASITSGTINWARLAQLPSAQLVGTLNFANLGNIPLAQWSGTVSVAQVGSIDADRIGAGTFGLARLGAVPFTQLNGTISTLQLGTVDGSAITNIVGTSITSGTINWARLAQLPSAQLAGTLNFANLGNIPLAQWSGTVSVAQVGSLDADRIGAGTFGLARLGAVPFAQLSGTISFAQRGPINNIDGASITTGTIDWARLAALPSAQLAGTLNFANLGNIPLAQWSGTVSVAQVGSLDADRIGAGTFGMARLGAIPFTQLNGTISLAQRGPIDGATITNIDGTSITTGTINWARLGRLPASELAGTLAVAQMGTTSVIAGSYGGPSWIPNFVVDIYGRLVSAGSTGIAISASQIASGTLSAARGGTGLSPTAGDANRVYGLNSAGSDSEFKTIAGSSGISILYSSGTITVSGANLGTVTQVATGVGLSGGTFSTSGTISLSTVGVTSGTFNSAGFVPTLQFDSFGRLTSMGSQAVAASAASFTGTLGVAKGGTGLDTSTAMNGSLLIGNGTGFTLGTIQVSNGLLVNTAAGTISITTNGTSANIGNTLVIRDGAGNFESNQATLQSLRLRNGAGTVTISIPGAGVYAMTLPGTIGAAGQVLTTNGVNQLSWTTPSAGAGLNGFYGSIAFSAPNADPHVSALVAVGTTANVDLVIAPKGSGAILGQIPDATAAGGNKRGLRAVDFQMSRSLSGQVASGESSGILSGINNTASGLYSFVGAGTTNTAQGFVSAIAGGVLNNASGAYSYIGGGYANQAVNNFAIVTGGASNIASGDSASVITGYQNQAQGGYSVITGGSNNIAIGGNSFIAGGSGNSASGGTSSVLGGFLNTAAGNYSAVAGVDNDAATFAQTTIGMYAVNMAGDATAPVAAEALFVIGNGTSDGARSNAMVVLKNGNIGIGTSAVSAGSRLEVAGGAITAANQGEMRMMEALGNGTSFVSFRAAAALGTTQVWTLPGVSGTAGQVLATNGAGILSWNTVPANGGTFLAADGTAGAPGFAFNSDTDTGIYRLGTSTLGISTGGTVRLAIDNAGNVGIGTVIPSSNLDIVETDTVGKYLMNLFQPSLATSNSTGLNIGRSTAVNDSAYIQYYRGSAAIHQLEFGFAGGNPKMIIQTDGGVGIGTTAPASDLQVNAPFRLPGSNVGQIAAYSTDPHAAGKGGLITMGGNDNTTGTVGSGLKAFAGIAGLKENGTGGDVAGYMALYTRPTAGTLVEQVRISSTGNMGVNTSAPTDTLHVVGNIRMVDGNQAVGRVLTSDATGVGTWAAVAGLSCPAGFTTINAGKPTAFCIQTVSNGLDTLTLAMQNCAAINDPTLGYLHLCTPEEFSTACKVGAGLPGIGTHLVFGLASATAWYEMSCTAGSVPGITIGGGSTPRAYRCCAR